MTLCCSNNCKEGDPLMPSAMCCMIVVCFWNMVFDAHITSFYHSADYLDNEYEIKGRPQWLYCGEIVTFMHTYGYEILFTLC